MLFSLDKTRRTISIFDPTYRYEVSVNQDPTTNYLKIIQTIGKAWDLAMEVVNPKWNDYIYDWVRGIPYGVEKSMDRSVYVQYMHAHL